MWEPRSLTTLWAVTGIALGKQITTNNSNDNNYYLLLDITPNLAVSPKPSFS
jgi:hypothetical protein